MSVPLPRNRKAKGSSGTPFSQGLGSEGVLHGTPSKHTHRAWAQPLHPPPHYSPPQFPSVFLKFGDTTANAMSELDTPGSCRQVLW